MIATITVWLLIQAPPNTYLPVAAARGPSVIATFATERECANLKWQLEGGQPSTNWRLGCYAAMIVKGAQ